MKSRAAKPRDSREQTENVKGARMRDARQKARLFTNGTNALVTAALSYDDPIYVLRKEIRDWRAASGLTNTPEHEHCGYTEGETRKKIVQGKKQLIAIITNDANNMSVTCGIK